MNTTKQLNTALQNREKAEGMPRMKNHKGMHWVNKKYCFPFSMKKKFQIRSIDVIGIWNSNSQPPLRSYHRKALELLLYTGLLFCVGILCIYLHLDFLLSVVYLSVVYMWSAQWIPGRSNKYALHSCHVIHFVMVWISYIPCWTLAP